MVHKLNKTKKESATMDSNVKYLNPKADLTFKLVFGEHPDLVMSLLNALLPLADDEQITHVEYITPEMVPENPAKKNSVVDVRCFDQMRPPRFRVLSVLSGLFFGRETTAFSARIIRSFLENNAYFLVV